MYDEPYFLNIAPQAHVTFEQPDEALKMVKGSQPTAYAIAMIYGSVCAPHMVAPSDCLPLILGEEMRFPDSSAAQRVFSLLFGIHNQISKTIEDDLPLTVRRGSYSSNKQGLLSRTDDRLNELEGFQEGLFSGVDRKSQPPRLARSMLHSLFLTSAV